MKVQQQSAKVKIQLNSIEDYYANDVDQIKVIGKGEIIMIRNQVDRVWYVHFR